MQPAGQLTPTAYYQGSMKAHVPTNDNVASDIVPHVQWSVRIRAPVLFAVVIGAGMGLVFGTELASFLGEIWNETVTPAFHNLLASGIAWC